MEYSGLNKKKNTALLHPYLLALTVCIGVWAFTLCDQDMISGTTLLMLSGAGLFLLFRRFISKEKPQYLKFSLCGAGLAGAAVGLYYLPFKGAYLLLAGIAVLLFLALKYKRKLIQPENLRILILLFSVFLYICYVLFTDHSYRQLDAGILHDGSGHLRYIEYLHDNWFMLPDFDPRTVMQLYHPPLYYYIAAAVVRFTELFGFSYEAAVNSAQVVTLFSAVCTLITADKLFQKAGLRGSGLNAALAITGLSVPLIMLSAMFNNDCLSIAFSVGAIYCTMLWYEKRTMPNIIKTALCVGLGMMTKLSVGVLAFPIGFVFVHAFFTDLRGFKRYLLQYLVFLAICCPLALWFPLKNLVIFGVPLGYVPAGAYSEYMQGIPVWKRLFDFSPQHFAAPVTTTAGGNIFGQHYDFEDYNPVIALIKSSSDMQKFSYADGIASVLYLRFWLILLMGVSGFISMISSLFVRKPTIERKKTVFFTILYASMMISYYIFCINFRNIYAENIRYVFPVLLTGALYYGALFRSRKNERINKTVKLLLTTAAAVYAATSVAMILFVAFEV